MIPDVGLPPDRSAALVLLVYRWIFGSEYRIIFLYYPHYVHVLTVYPPPNFICFLKEGCCLAILHSKQTHTGESWGVLLFQQFSISFYTFVDPIVVLPATFTSWRDVRFEATSF